MTPEILPLRYGGRGVQLIPLLRLHILQRIRASGAVILLTLQALKVRRDRQPYIFCFLKLHCHSSEGNGTDPNFLSFSITTTAFERSPKPKSTIQLI